MPFASKKVFRHLRDGDILLLNRYLASQPATHAAQAEYDGAQGESVAWGADNSHALRKLVSKQGPALSNIAHISLVAFHTTVGDFVLAPVSAFEDIPIGFRR